MDAQHEGRKVCTIIQALQLVGVSRRTIYNWILSGKVETIKTASGLTRIYVDSLWRRAA